MPRNSRPINAIGRKRGFLGGLLLSWGLLTAVAWASSGWHWAEIGTDRRVIGLSNGRLFFWRMYPPRSGSKTAEACRERSDGSTEYVLVADYLAVCSECAWEWKSDAHLPVRRGWTWWEQPGPRVYGSLTADACAIYSLSTHARGIPFDTMACHTVLLWPFPILAGVAGSLLASSGVRARRRSQRGMCIHCGYNLTGTTTTNCPECGEPKAKPQINAD